MFKNLMTIWHFITLTFIAFFVVVFLFLLGINPIDVGKFFGAKIGLALDVTSSASVPANPFNVVALQLKEKEISLNEREKNLDNLQNKIVGETDSLRQWLIYLIPLVIALCILVLMNFYFDNKERKILEKIEADEKKIMEAEKRLEKKIDEKK